MIPKANWFQHILNKHLNSPIVSNISRVSGGDINESFKVETSNGSYFIKTNGPDVGNMFLREQAGLQILHQTKTLRTPNVIGSGSSLGTPYLLLEFINKGYPRPNFWEEFAHQLSQLHQVTQEKFGLDHDNYVGKLPQKNNTHSSWTEFFILCRIEPQLKLAKDKGLADPTLIRNMENLFNQLDSIFPSEPPSLIHGDLWSGNFMSDEHGNPCIYDPAIYFGHREMELAFTQLFGGFDPGFYKHYENNYPLSPGFDSRVDLYNLYPLLVHVNLFGPSYLSGIKMTLKRFT